MKERIVNIIKFLKRNKAFTKTLSMFLSIILVFYVIPSTIYAEAAEFIEDITKNAEEIDLETVAKEAVFEDKSLREESVKYFRLSDGSYVAAQYNYPVHSLDENGKWQDINNTLFKNGSEYSNENARIKFAKKINGSSILFALHDGNAKITLNLIGAQKGTKGEVVNGNDAAEETELQKMMNLENISASIIYKDIIDGVDVEYVAYSNNIKENIIVKEKKNNYSYSFELKLNGLSPILRDNGDIELVDDDTQKIAYIIPSPTVFDASGEFAPRGVAYYTLNHENGKKYILTVSVDSSWMNTADRVYPITIDPPIKKNGSSAIDVNIDSSNPSSSNSSSEELTVMNTADRTMLVYWKMSQLPTLPASAKITEAYITLFKSSGSGAHIGAYEVAGDWDATLNWQNHTDNSNPLGLMLGLADYVTVATAKEYSWNITKLAEKWYGGANYGVAFASLSENTITRFYSNEATSKPALTIAYQDMKGLESYWPYISHDAGIAGVGNVNLVNGNLVLAIPTLTATDSIFAYTPHLIYDSYLSGVYYSSATANVFAENPFLGAGFEFSVCETIMKYRYTDDDFYYVYSDADGTEHYFLPVSENVESVFMDEDGLGLTMRVDGSGSITIENINQEIKSFQRVVYSDGTIGWRLAHIEDAGGNRLVYGYDEQHRPSNISLLPNGNNSTPIELLEFRYNDTTGRLVMVYNPTAELAAVVRYSSSYNSEIAPNSYGYIRRIDYATGVSSVTSDDWYAFALDKNVCNNITVYDSALYNYDSSGRIVELVSEKANRSIRYTWNGSEVVGISEYAGEDKGQELVIEYNHGFAEVRQTGNDEIINTEDDILTRYIIDRYGRAVSVYSCSADGTEIYGGTTGIYDTQSESKNSLTDRVIVGEVRPNLLLNGDFQKLSLPRTVVSGWILSTNATIERGYNVVSPSTLYLKMLPDENEPSTASQTVSLSEGDYTFSMYYSTSLCTNIDGRVDILDADTGAVIHSENVITNESGTAKQGIVTAGFTLSEEMTVTVLICFSATGSTNTNMSISVGKAKLEQGIGCTDFNFINADGFDITPDSSSIWVANQGETQIVTDEETFGECLQISANMGESYVKQSLMQRTPLELKEYDYFVPIQNTELQFALSGYAKADNPLLGKEFRLYAEVTYYYGADEDDITVIYPVNFAAIPGEWQYTVGTFALGKYADGTDLPIYSCVKSVAVYCGYSNQADGYAYFDNISLVFCGLDKTEKNIYLGGRLVRNISESRETFYVYNSDGNIERIADNKGNLIVYHYNSENVNLVDCAVEYTYTYQGRITYYPYNMANHDTLVVKIPKRKTDYTYNSYGMLTEIHTYELADTGAVASDGSYSKQSYVYETGADSKIFGALIREKNADAELVYIYDEARGLLLVSANNESHYGYYYTYDASGRLIAVEKATVVEYNYTVHSDAEKVVYEYDAQNRLKEISTRSTSYTLTYDAFGNSESIDIGDKSLAEYEYYENNGKLRKTIYGNGYEVEYIYDDLERLKEVRQKTAESDAFVTAYEYEYTADGSVRSLRDNISGIIILYMYDETGRLESMREYSSGDYELLTEQEVTYNALFEVTAIKTGFSYLSGTSRVNDSISKSFTYLDDGRLNTYTVSGDFTSTTEYFYDTLDRISSIVYNNSVNGSVVTQEYSYTYGIDSTHGESAFVGTLTAEVGDNTVTYTYGYNSAGNLTSIRYSDGRKIVYTYDSLGQLKTEDNDITGFYYTYTYDKAGNIVATLKTPQSSGNNNGEVGLTSIGDGAGQYALKPNLPPVSTVTNTYTYSDSEWGDLLTAFNGVAITYDDIGNPLSYYNGSSYTFTWRGRELATAHRGAKEMSFAYNDQGLRISKTVNGVTTHYVYDGSILLAEYTDTLAIVYIYDATGAPIGFKCRTSTYAADTWDVYWYEKNLRGDIVAVYSSTGAKLISYAYNAWGVTTKAYSNGGASTTAVNNNLTYRGYYYDNDLGMYYLHSRYYDQNVCRFISIDTLVPSVNSSAHGYNLYVYCFNNPLTFVDSNGEWPEWIENCVAWIIGNTLIPIIDELEGSLSGINGTYSTGLAASITVLGGTFGGQVGVSVDSRGNLVLQWTVFSGASTSVTGASVTRYHTVTNAPSVNNLLEHGYQLGASLGGSVMGIPVVGSVDGNIIPGDEKTYNGITLNYGIGTAGWENHALIGYTYNLHTPINLFELFTP